MQMCKNVCIRDNDYYKGILQLLEKKMLCFEIFINYLFYNVEKTLNICSATYIFLLFIIIIMGIINNFFYSFHIS